MPLFEVLLPVRNGIKFLNKSISSISSQTVSDWKMHILDHSSTDGSLELASRLAEDDKRITVTTVAAQDFSALLNFGLDTANCRFLLRQDADDISLPLRMAKTLAAFEAKRDLIVVGGQYVSIDSRDRIRSTIRLPATGRALAAAAFFRNPIAHPTATFDMERLNKLGARYGVDFTGSGQTSKDFYVPGLAEDYFLFAQLCALGRCYNVDEPLIQYRTHGSSVGATNNHDQLSLSFRLSSQLARSWSQSKGLDYFDVVPFCNHGTTLVSDNTNADRTSDFEVMARALRNGLGNSAELERELAFRFVIANRRPAEMLARFANFLLKHRPTPFEARTIYNWIFRPQGRLLLN